MSSWQTYANRRFFEYLVFEALKTRATVERDGFRLHVDRTIPKVNRRYLFHKFDRYEDDEVELLGSVLESGDRVLELGAGLGIVSLHILRMVTDAGFLVAVEANSAPFAVLKQNLALNASSFLCLEGMAELSEGTARFYVNQRNLHRSSARDAKASDERSSSPLREIEVKQVSIPKLISEHRLNALVMDIEGGEEEILDGYDLAGIDKLACEFHPGVYGDETKHRLDQLITSRGFEKVAASGDSASYRRR